MENELVKTVKRLIEAGCHYRLDDLAQLYSEDLTIVMAQSNGDIRTFNYKQNMDFFTSLRDKGAPPMDTSAQFLHADVQDKLGYVIVVRAMDLGQGAQTIVFNLMLKKDAENNWKVFREHAIIMDNSEQQRDMKSDPISDRD